MNPRRSMVTSDHTFW